ncbi:MAG: ABC transporter ATP-binding protein [Clostridiales bacterium]|nr:ABC transporter ATP-binding protein [Clostridiales bacterium]
MQLIWKYIKPYLWRMAGGMSSKFLGTVVELFIPSLLAVILDDIIPLQDAGKVYLYGGLMVLCALLAWAGNVVANRVAASVSRDSVRQLRHDLFDHIMQLTSREIDRFTVPSLISRMTTDTFYVYRVVGMMQRIGIRAPILLLGGILITLSLDSALSLLMIAMMPFMVLIVYFISKKGVPLYARLQEHVDNLVRIVRENMTGARIIKALCKTEDEKARFRHVNEQVASSETRAASIMSINSPTMQFLLNMGLVLVVYVGARRVHNGLSQPGNIVAFLSYFTIILNAMLTITRILTMYSKALASARRIEEVMNGETEQDAQVLLPADANAPKVEFENVSFSYNKKQPDVQGISFKLGKGEHLGILGPTGSGKSTLVKLLMRLYDVDAGSIRIDGVDVRQIPLGDLRRKFGVVFQNDALFRGTIEENVKLGREISMEEVDKALHDAQAAQFVAEKGGADSEVVSRGHNFSGGQQQRMLVSRALAGTPELLILDDASSALDFRTEAALRRALREEYRNTATVMIAQRISAIMHCDVILVLDEGEMKGLGTHEELMESCELYREIAALQLGGDEHANG